MITLTIAEAARILGLKASSSIAFAGISIDSRTLAPGNLFVAIPGTHYDGHAFIPEAEAKGAAALLVHHPVTTNLPQLIVPDVIAALGKLTAYWRSQFTIPFVGVTGSNGKTTLKNMLANILKMAASGHSEGVLATQGNFNNQLGLPLTLARLSAQHRYAVLEMGMNHLGEIAYLCQLTPLNVAIITNAAACHLAGVGSLDGVAQAKAEIFTGLTPDGVAILNRDDYYYNYWCEKVQQHISFGFNAEADVWFDKETYAQGQPTTIITKKGSFTIALPLLGEHNIHNALAATAAALALDLSFEVIKSGLEVIQPEPHRLQLYQLKNGTNVIDDSYNANPFSLRAAINTLATFKGKKILVLGDMNELGAEEQAIHQDAGQLIREAGIDRLLTYGSLSANATLAFGDGAEHFHEQEKLIHALKSFIERETTILIKGSCSMKMEKVVQELLQWMK